METKSFVFGFFYVKTLNFYHRKVACKVADLSAVKILAVQINTEYFLKSTTLCNFVQFGGGKKCFRTVNKSEYICLYDFIQCKTLHFCNRKDA